MEDCHILKNICMSKKAKDDNGKPHDVEKQCEEEMTRTKGIRIPVTATLTPLTESKPSLGVG